MFQEFQSSVFWFQPLDCGQRACAQSEITIHHLGGGLRSYRRIHRCASDHFEHPLRRNQDTSPSLHYRFWTAFPLFLYSLTPLSSNCLNLPFGTQGSSRRLKPFSYKQETGDIERFLHLGGTHRVLLGFICTASLNSAPWSPRLPHPIPSPALVPEAARYPEPFNMQELVILVASHWLPLHPLSCIYYTQVTWAQLGLSPVLWG